MQIGFKLKQLLLNYRISIAKDREYQSIDLIDATKEKEVLLFVEKLLVSEMYFIYKEGNSKFSDQLEVVKRENILNYYSGGLTLFSLKKMDVLDIWRYSGYDGEKVVDAIEIITSGEFNLILKELEQQAYGKISKRNGLVFIEKRN